MDLILNPTSLDHVNTGTATCADDVDEAIYDKAWPLELVGIDFPSLLHIAQAPNPPFGQMDRTTRQLTYILYNAHEPVSIVSHSQGCLQTRNALWAVNILGKGNNIDRSVAWVATGCPLNSSEIQLRPAKLNILVNSSDPVGKLIGIRGGPNLIQTILFENPQHEPIRNYFPQIKPFWLFD